MVLRSYFFCFGSWRLALQLLNREVYLDVN